MMTSFSFPHLCGFLYSLIMGKVPRNSKEMLCHSDVTLRNTVHFLEFSSSSKTSFKNSANRNLKFPKS